MEVEQAVQTSFDVLQWSISCWKEKLANIVTCFFWDFRKSCLYLPLWTYGLNWRCCGMSFHSCKSHGGVTNFVICLLIVVAIFNDSFDSPSRGFLFIIVSLMSLLFSSALTIQFFFTIFCTFYALSSLFLQFNFFFFLRHFDD